MEQLKQQRDAIVKQCAKIKEDIDHMNEEISNRMNANDHMIADMMNENRELATMRSDNENLLKPFGKLLKRMGL